MARLTRLLLTLGCLAFASAAPAAPAAGDTRFVFGAGAGDLVWGGLTVHLTPSWQVLAGTGINITYLGSGRIDARVGAIWTYWPAEPPAEGSDAYLLVAAVRTLAGEGFSPTTAAAGAAPRRRRRGARRRASAGAGAPGRAFGWRSSGGSTTSIGPTPMWSSCTTAAGSSHRACASGSTRRSDSDGIARPRHGSS